MFTFFLTTNIIIIFHTLHFFCKNTPNLFQNMKHLTKKCYFCQN